MSAFDIQGRNCVFQLKIGDVYLDVICAKTFSINVTTQMKDTTTVGGLGTGWWKEQRPRKLDYSISFNGTVQVLADGDKPTIKTMFQNQLWFLPMDYRIIYEDDSENVMVLLGRVYNANTVINANPINLLDGTVELQGTGPIEQNDALPNPVNLRLIMVDDGTGLQVGKARFVLKNAEGGIVFQTDDMQEAVSGYLVGPAFDITTQIEAGNYFYYFQAVTETDANVFHSDVSLSETQAFPSGVYEKQSEEVKDFTVAREMVISLGPSNPPPACVDVQIVGSPTAPDGMVGQSYGFVISLTGSAPFAVSNVTKPEWVDILVNNFANVIIVSGFPDAEGTGIEISFDITNCSSGIATFSDTLNVVENPNAVQAFYALSESEGANGTLRIYRNGLSVPMVTLTSSGAGSLTVEAGDTLEAVLSVGTGQTSELIIDDDIDGNLYSNTTGGGVKTFSWVVQLGHVYDIYGEANN